jgi:hypothetical protein
MAAQLLVNGEYVTRASAPLHGVATASTRLADPFTPQQASNEDCTSELLRAEFLPYYCFVRRTVGPSHSRSYSGTAWLNAFRAGARRPASWGGKQIRRRRHERREACGLGVTPRSIWARGARPRQSHCKIRVFRISRSTVARRAFCNVRLQRLVHVENPIWDNASLTRLRYAWFMRNAKAADSLLDNNYRLARGYCARLFNHPVLAMRPSTKPIGS